MHRSHACTAAPFVKFVHSLSQASPRSRAPPTFTVQCSQSADTVAPMRALPCCAALALAACSTQNPFFGLDTDSNSSSATDPGGTTSAATATPTSQGPTTVDPTSAPTTTTTEPATTDNPSEPLTSGTGQLDTGLPSDTTTTAANTTGDNSGSSSGDSTTGDPACMLHKDPDFDDRLRINGQLADKCAASPTYFTGRLVIGLNALQFQTTATGCENESGLGLLALGSNYSLPSTKISPCAKLWLYRDGPGPACDIAQFYVIAKETNLALAVGSFSPQQPVLDPPPILVTPTPELLPCCDAQAQMCCDDGMFGDFSLAIDNTDVLPGETKDLMLDGMPGRFTNIQHWQTTNCDTKEPSARRDWAGVRQ